MVETITPVVHGGRRSKWAVSLAVHALGSVITASGVGALLGAAGAVLRLHPGQVGLVAVAAIAALYAGRELFGLPIPLPERRGQVPEWWRTFFSPRTASFLFGLSLGVGGLTFLGHGTIAAAWVGALVSGDPLLGALLIGPFGLSRALAASVVGGATTSESMRRIVDRLEAVGASRLPALVNGVILAAVSLAAGSAALRSPGEPLTRFAPPILAVVFAWAAVSKVARLPAWRQALAAHRLPPPMEALARVGVPAAEVLVAGLVLTGRHGPAALLATVLLGGFSVSVLLLRARGTKTLGCGCFGRRTSRDYRLVLARNAVLAAVAGVALTAEGSGAAGLTIRPPASGELLPIMLVFIAVTIGFWTLRQVTRSLKVLER